jgi:hypothetical protein
MPDNNPLAKVEQQNPVVAGLVNLTTPMGLVPDQIQKVRVILVRSGNVPEQFSVPVGTTVRDLFSHAKAETQNQTMMIGKEEVKLDHVLTKDTLLFSVSKPKNA